VARGRSKSERARTPEAMNAFMIRDSAFLVRDSVDHRLQTRISELVDLVRKAFADSRRQDCSALAKAILELDPQNDDALFIQSWIQCEIEQDLQLAHSLLPDLKKDETLCKEAQLIIQRVLELDPGNKAAEALRVEIDSALPTHDLPGEQNVTLGSDLLVDESADPQPAIEAIDQQVQESIADLQPAHESVAESRPTHKSVAAPQPTTGSVSELEPAVEPVADSQPTHEYFAEFQPSYDSTPDAVSTPEQTFDSVTDSAEDESVFESDVSDLESEFDRWPYAQPKAAERKIWGRRNILVGSVILLSIIAFVRYRGIPRWFTSESAATTVTTDSNTQGESDAFDTTASSGTLEIVIDEGVDVFINDQYAGTAPIAPIKSKPGTYQLSYRFGGMDIGREQVTIAAGQLTRNSMRAFLGSLEIFVLPATNTVMQLDDSPAVPVQTHVAVRPGNHRLTFTAAGYQPSTASVSVVAGQPRNVTVILQPVILGSPQPTDHTAAPSRPPVQNTPAAPNNVRNDVSAVTSATGTLAVSSLLPVDIYVDNNHVGTTPVTLELPVGTYTVEYRYGNLRKTAVNVIRGNEVTRATVVFEVTVQITSTPQAEVSLGGIQPKALGTTPLTAVRVPIGSSLIFRTPGFPDKSYTVTEKDTTISMVFP
jgi:hypothetical protein